MLRSTLTCRNHRIIRIFLLLAIGSIFSLLFRYNFMMEQRWKSPRKWNKTELCRRLENASNANASNANASNSTDLPQLPPEEFYIRMLTARSPPRGDSFDPQISATELRAELNLLWKFLDLCEQHNITVMMYGGTLLGSYRHHGVIPWDDDGDVLMDVDDKGKLSKALNGNSGFRVSTEKRENAVWRVSSKSACFHKSGMGCWPFIDVSFFKLQNGWVNDLTSPDYRYPENVTFPLHKRPFMGRWVNSPRDALKFLSLTYTPSDLCTGLHFSHKFGVIPGTSRKGISCKELASTYPFVFRVPDSAPASRGAAETLRFLEGGPVYTVPVDEPVGVINTEYSTLESWECP